jgi:hypothetical protein
LPREASVAQTGFGVVAGCKDDGTGFFGEKSCIGMLLIDLQAARPTPSAPATKGNTPPEL